MAGTSSFLGPNATLKRLRFGGTCIACGGLVPPGANGWHDPDAKKIGCAPCGAGTAAENADPGAVAPPVGGSSALKWSEHGNRLNRRKGATAEYLMETWLLRDLQAGEVVLSDRRVPGGKGNIDHVVIARSGVWVIDTKQWKGRIEYRASAESLMPTSVFSSAARTAHTSLMTSTPK